MISRRVAVLPVHHSLESGATSIEYLGSTLLNELNGKAKLEAVSLTRTSLQRLVESLPCLTSTLPSGLLGQIRSLTGADGVLLTDLTHYYPYKPISIGVRCKLADAVTGKCFGLLIPFTMQGASKYRLRHLLSKRTEQYTVPSTGYRCNIAVTALFQPFCCLHIDGYPAQQVVSSKFQ